MSEKDIIENKDNSVDKAENNKMPGSATQEKKIESKSDEVKSEDKDKESKLQKIKQLTEQGMNGLIPFQDSLDQRLQSIEVTKKDVQLLNEMLIGLITPSFTEKPSTSRFILNF